MVVVEKSNLYFHQLFLDFIGSDFSIKSSKAPRKLTQVCKFRSSHWRKPYFPVFFIFSLLLSARTFCRLQKKIDLVERIGAVEYSTRIKYHCLEGPTFRNTNFQTQIFLSSMKSWFLILVFWKNLGTFQITKNL